MKTKTNPHEEDNERYQSGEEKSAGLTAPSQKGHPNVETEPTSNGKNSRIIEESMPLFDDPLPPILSLPSSRGQLAGCADHRDSIAMFIEDCTNGWDPRLEREIHLEEFPGCHGGSYQLLFLQNSIFVSAHDFAQALTHVGGHSPDMVYTAAELIRALDIREVIEFPSPEIPANFERAVRGSFIPLELMCAVLHGGELGGDARELLLLLDQFENRKAWVRLKKLREACLREEKLYDEKWRKARLQSAKRAR